MTDAADHLMDWLRDAHAAEQQAATMLKGMAGRLMNYPTLKTRIEKHVEETERQAALVRGCIERRGGTTSTVKDAGAKMIAMGQALSGAFVDDEVLKGAIASTAFEAMEIASYRILISAAEEVGDVRTAQICKEILAEEEAMESWLNEHLPSLTQQYLQLEGFGAQAKR